MSNLESSGIAAGYDELVMVANLRSLLKCPLCFDIMTPPIMHCLNGHLVCKLCQEKRKDCHSCGCKEFMRNYAMENVAANLTFPCKYSSHSCTALLSYADKTEHESKCLSRPFYCPYVGVSCKWHGNRHQVVNHLTSSHKTITLRGDVVEFNVTDVLQPKPIAWALIQLCFGHQFLFAMKKHNINGEDHYFAFVQCNGSEKEVSRFFYQLQIKSGESMTVTGVPQPIQESFQSVIQNSSFAFHISGANMKNHATSENRMTLKIIITVL